MKKVYQDQFIDPFLKTAFNIRLEILVADKVGQDLDYFDFSSVGFLYCLGLLLMYTQHMDR